MTDTAGIEAMLVMLVGVSLIAAVLIKSASDWFGVPALVGYMLFGILLRLVDQQWRFIDQSVELTFRFLADLGVVALLFKVGLDSSPSKLIAKLPQAAVIWTGDVVLSAAIGFIAAFYLLGLALVPSLVVATALTATSIGVSVAVWDQRGALGSANGQLLIDVAELDDISGVALMALLFAVVPVLLIGDGNLWPLLAATAGRFTLTFAGFLLFCLLFAVSVEPRLTRLAGGLRQPPELMLVVVGIGFLIASLAGGLGFSLAIGALFAGLVFSRDPKAVKTERSFRDLYAFVTPFFFIGIGFNIDPSTLTDALPMGALLLGAAVIGKLVGDGLPSYITLGAGSAAVIATSMVPRAEIAMVIMHKGQQMGPEVVPPTVYAGMVIVSAATCLLTPLFLQRVLTPTGELGRTGKAGGNAP